MAFTTFKTRTINIFATENEDGQEWNHKDWFYKLTEAGKRIGKLYRSRAAASRAAGKLGKVVHWYPI